MFKTVTVEIRRSELSTIRSTVPAWELPLLRAVHGVANLTPVEEGKKDAPLPETEPEFERLANRYGRERKDDGSVGDPIVEAVYGKFEAGLMALRRNIDAAAISGG